MKGVRGEDRQEATGNWPEMSVKPYFENESVRLYHGDCMDLLLTMQTTEMSRIDALITDPPYCSGAATKSGRDADPVEKYCHGGNACGRPTFAGDARDPRSFQFWCTMWMQFARRHCRDAAYILSFIDWRQLSGLIDSVQAAGWAWKGLIAWDKGRGARAPHKGYFRHQAEYVVWGNNGKVPRLTDRGPFDGVYSIPVKQIDKHHITGKPTELLRELVRSAAGLGELILDPFAGSGTTGVAATFEGRRAILFEQSVEYCEIAAQRLEAAARGELKEFVRKAA